MPLVIDVTTDIKALERLGLQDTFEQATFEALDQYVVNTLIPWWTANIPKRTGYLRRSAEFEVRRDGRGGVGLYVHAAWYYPFVGEDAVRDRLRLDSNRIGIAIAKLMRFYLGRR